MDAVERLPPGILTSPKFAVSIVGAESRVDQQASSVLFGGTGALVRAPLGPCGAGCLPRRARGRLCLHRAASRTALSRIPPCPPTRPPRAHPAAILGVACGTHRRLDMEVHHPSQRAAGRGAQGNSAAGRAACAVLAGGGARGSRACCVRRTCRGRWLRGIVRELGRAHDSGPSNALTLPPPPTSRTLRTPWPRPLLMACPLSHTTWEASLRCWSLAALQVSSAHACRARGGGRPCCARPRQPASDGVHGARQPTTSTLQAACAAFIVRLVIDIPLACSQSCRSPPTSRVPCSRCATSWPKCCVAGAGPRPRCAALTATQVLLPVILLCAPTVPARSPSALPCFPPALLLQTRYGALGTLKACCPRGRANAHWRRLGCRRAPRCTPCPSTRT